MARNESGYPILGFGIYFCYDLCGDFEISVKKMKKKYLILGYGISGKAVAQLLNQLKIEYVIADKNPTLPEIVKDGEDFSLDQIEKIIISPGISNSHPLLRKANKMGVEVVSEIEFAFGFIQNRSVGITGTNGKTTTTYLIEYILNGAKIKAKAVGNVGFALSSYVLNPDPEEILIIELSSYQLENLKAKKLEAALYLNLTPDHLDRYSSIEEYASAKMNIQNCLIENGKFFVSSQVFQKYKNQIFVKNITLFDQEELESIPPFEYIKLGRPERQNVLAAKAICDHFGVNAKTFEAHLRSFHKPPHRIEWILDRNEVSYFNDSKSTNIDSVMHAVALFDRPIILILGGVDKGASYRPWIGAFKNKVKKMICYGMAALKMEEELSSYFSLIRVETLTQAVRAAKMGAQNGDCVLLSPGCSSFDQFRNYAHRGEVFKQLVIEESL